MKSLWAAAPLPGPAGDNTPNVFGALIRFLLLTAARRGEATSLLWSEISEGVWTLPSAKNKTGEVLGPTTLSGCFRRAGVSPPHRRSRLHSLRHRTNRRPQRMQERPRPRKWCQWLAAPRPPPHFAQPNVPVLGAPSDHAERCLGHVIGGVRGIYDRHSFRGEMAEAYEKLAALIADIVA